MSPFSQVWFTSFGCCEGAGRGLLLYISFLSIHFCFLCLLDLCHPFQLLYLHSLFHNPPPSQKAIYFGIALISSWVLGLNLLAISNTQMPIYFSPRVVWRYPELFSHCSERNKTTHPGVFLNKNYFFCNFIDFPSLHRQNLSFSSLCLHITKETVYIGAPGWLRH